MAKRNADKELTDRNWDQEDEGEEAGTFSVASHDVLKNRAIKKAKRRNTGGEPENPGAFKSFKGFSLTQPAASGGPTTGFSGFGNGAGFKGLAGLTNGNGSAPSFGGFSVAATTPGLMFNGPASTKPSADVGSKQSNGSVPSSSQSSGACSGGSVGSNKEYSRQLTALNCSVRDWITKHVNDNPLCDLNPIFKDYEQHLASIERKYGAAQPAHGASESNSSGEKQGDANPPLSSSSSSCSSSSSSAALFSFGRDKEGSGQDKSGGSVLPVGGTFNFGQKVDSSALGSSPPCFSFSSKPSSSSSGQSSLFGASAAPFSFSGAKAEASQHTDENGDEESEEPPKPEVREIKEKDAFYSKKCKLFYKKELEFKEKGVGTLHLKTTAESKTQMIIRADTNLGNILLNVIAQPSMPCSRVGKNNVVVVCVPNPPVDDKNPSGPVPLLIRVKTAEDADELHNILEEKKV